VPRRAPLHLPPTASSPSRRTSPLTVGGAKLQKTRTSTEDPTGGPQASNPQDASLTTEAASCSLLPASRVTRTQITRAAKLGSPRLGSCCHVPVRREAALTSPPLPTLGPSSRSRADPSSIAASRGATPKGYTSRSPLILTAPGSSLP
jgi:hypothetical protein